MIDNNRDDYTLNDDDKDTGDKAAIMIMKEIVIRIKIIKMILQ